MTLQITYQDLATGLDYILQGWRQSSADPIKLILTKARAGQYTPEQANTPLSETFPLTKAARLQGHRGDVTRAWIKSLP